MSEHPSAYELEAYFVGETNDGVRKHLVDCAECAEYVQGLLDERSDMLAGEPATSFMSRTPIAEALETADDPSGFFGRFKFVVLVPLGLMAALVIFAALQDPAPQKPLIDTITYKGQGLQLGVIRQRGQDQSNHSGTVEVRKNDAIRVRVTLPRPGRLTVGVLSPDGAWLPLCEARDFKAGTHVVHSDALVITDVSTMGRVVAGTPQSVARLRAGESAPEVTVLTIKGSDKP